MNGPQHYAEAERMVAHVEQQAVELVAACAASGGRAADLTATNEVIANMTAVAHVHATLALAAATVDASTGATREYLEWAEVLA